MDQAEMLVEGDALVLRRPKAKPRKGWAAASQLIAILGDDALVQPEFSSEGNEKLAW